MSNEDETERETGKSEKSTSDSQRKGNSLGAALEASLQAVLQSVSDGLGKLVEENKSDIAPSRRSPRPRPSTGRKQANQNQRIDTVKRKREKQVGKPESEECLIDTRFTDGEFIVVADMLGASIDDISVGIHPKTNELVISKTDTVVERIDLPWTSPEMKKAWFKNGILEVYMKSEDSESFKESPS